MATLALFWSFFKVGLFGWGGGAALFPLIEAECATNGYLDGSTERLAEAFAVTNAVPGVTAVKLAAYIGWEEGGVLGLLAATSGVILPGVALLFLLYGTLLHLKTSPDASPRAKELVTGLVNGLQFGAAGFVLYSAWKIIPGDVSGHLLGGGVAMSALVIVALAFKAPPIPVILVCAALGIIFFR